MSGWRSRRGDVGSAAAESGEPFGRGTSSEGTVLPGTKSALMVERLIRPHGAAIASIAAATGWQPHTLRRAMSGALKKRLGLEVTSEKVEGRGLVYRLPSA